MGRVKKVLYVDDEEINLLVLSKRLKKKFKVLTAESGEEGLKILGKDPDLHLIISDLKMPGMSGLEFIKKAKELFNDRRYFLLTGFTKSKEAKEALEAGLIEHCWEKPVDFKDIEDYLK